MTYNLVMHNSFKILLVSFTCSALMVSMFISPITMIESYLGKLLSSILDSSSIKDRMFDAGGLYMFKTIHLLLSVLISRGSILMMLDSRYGICFGSSLLLTK